MNDVCPQVDGSDLCGGGDLPAVRRTGEPGSGPLPPLRQPGHPHTVVRRRRIGPALFLTTRNGTRIITVDVAGWHVDIRRRR